MLMFYIYLRRKGFHDYWESFEKFKESLPNKGKFYNILTNCAITDKIYENVLNVWQAFEMNTMKDYQNLCLSF